MADVSSDEYHNKQKLCAAHQQLRKGGVQLSRLSTFTKVWPIYTVVQFSVMAKKFYESELNFTRQLLYVHLPRICLLSVFQGRTVARSHQDSAAVLLTGSTKTFLGYNKILYFLINKAILF